jgi:hypothetical protein
MPVNLRLAAIAPALLLALTACAPEGSGTASTAAIPGASTTPFEGQGPHLYITNLVDGQTVKSPVRVAFGLQGYGVAPAGVTMPNTGHHHLFIDTTAVTPGAPVPADPNHVHFGGGQTETAVTLTPGQHTLMLVLADANHVPFTPSIQSEPITITVTE